MGVTINLSLHDDFEMNFMNLIPVNFKCGFLQMISLFRFKLEFWDDVWNVGLKLSMKIRLEESSI